MKYDRSCLSVLPYSKTSSTIILDATFSTRSPSLIYPIPFVASS